MTDMRASNVTRESLPRAARSASEPGVASLRESIDSNVPASLSADALFRAQLSEIGDTARQAQVAAETTRRAEETFSAIERAMTFALDVAREARDARSLPEDAIAAMQKEIDLAINTVDGIAGEASFAGKRLFDGSMTMEVAGKRLELPKISSSSIGSCRARPVCDAEVDDAGTGIVDYSKSIASTAAGGPNSLSFWAGGAVTALEDGIRQIQQNAAAVQGFRAGVVAPAVNYIDVMLSNALAAQPGGASLDGVVTLLARLRKELDASAASAVPSVGVVKLLE